MTDTDIPALPVELLQAVAPQRTKNTLTLPQQLKLAKWCQENAETCETETYPKLAGIATISLEFTVTPANMSSTIEACEIERKKPDAPLTLEQQVALIRLGLETLRQDDRESQALRGTVSEILSAMRALTARVDRLERREMDRGAAVVETHPNLPGLPPPEFGDRQPPAHPCDVDRE